MTARKKSPRKRGRPTKFTPPTRKAIVAAIGRGAFQEQAGKAAGVAPATLMEWLAKGRAGEPGFVDFLEDVQRAQGEARLSAESRVHEDSPKDWLRLGPGRDKTDEPGWTERQKLELSGDQEKPIRLNLRSLIGEGNMGDDDE